MPAPTGGCVSGVWLGGQERSEGGSEAELSVTNPRLVNGSGTVTPQPGLGQPRRTGLIPGENSLKPSVGQGDTAHPVIDSPCVCRFGQQNPNPHPGRRAPAASTWHQAGSPEFHPCPSSCKETHYKPSGHSSSCRRKQLSTYRILKHSNTEILNYQTLILKTNLTE